MRVGVVDEAEGVLVLDDTVVSSSRLALPPLIRSSGRFDVVSSRSPTVPKPDVVPMMMKPLLALAPLSQEFTIAVTSTET